MSIRRALPLGLSVLVLAGCALGPRPTLVDVAEVDDAAANAVLERLDRTPNQAFTATYDIAPAAASARTIATVHRSIDGTTETRIGDVVFTSYPNGTSTTCDPIGEGCDEYTNDARVSDLSITNRFWGPAFEQRLRTDVSRRIGPSEGSTVTIGDQSATCVTVSVPSPIEAVGAVVYCALDIGVLARYVGADVVIELTSFQIDG